MRSLILCAASVALACAACGGGSRDRMRLDAADEDPGSGGAGGDGGSGGAAGAGGGGGGGTAGSGGAGGKDAGSDLVVPTGDCCAIAKAYADLLAASLTCDPAGADQCNTRVDDCLETYSGSTCPAFVNMDKAADLKVLRGAYTANDCYGTAGMKMSCGMTTCKGGGPFGGGCSSYPGGPTYKGRCNASGQCESVMM